MVAAALAAAAAVAAEAVVPMVVAMGVVDLVVVVADMEVAQEDGAIRLFWQDTVLRREENRREENRRGDRAAAGLLPLDLLSQTVVAGYRCHKEEMCTIVQKSCVRFHEFCVCQTGLFYMSFLDKHSNEVFTCRLLLSQSHLYFYVNATNQVEINLFLFFKTRSRSG